MTTQAKAIGIRIDIETRGRTDVKHGSYRYAEDPDFSVLVIAVSPVRKYPGGAVRFGQPRSLPLSGGSALDQFRAALINPRFQKHAYNANFERICLSAWLGMPPGTYIDPINWRCSAIQANTNGVFGRLDEVARAIRAPIAKDPEGRRLIKLFSLPDKKTGLFHEPLTYEGECWCGAGHGEDFLRFRAYCEQDVKTEAVISSMLPPISAEVQAEYEADQRINDRGFRHFRALSEQAVAQVDAEKSRLMGELKKQMGVENPNSVQQFRGWLEAQEWPMVSLDKAHREEALADPDCPQHVKDALVKKGAASLTSVTKHKAALNTRCADGRIRGSLQFYGAHTGREAGRGIQPQNLPKKNATKTELRRLVSGNAGTDAPEIAKGAVRASIVPAKGCVFAVADYNAIEARCLAWETGEAWVQAEFAGDGKIYEATAQTMFGVDKYRLIAARAKCGECGKCRACSIRAKSKVAELALGYAGGAGALVTMGAEAAGIDCGNYNELHAIWVAAGRPGKFHEWEHESHNYPELLRLRDLYRDARPETVRFWKLCAKAWDLATTGKGARFGSNGILAMVRDGRHNRLILPSNRSIWYRFAKSHLDPDNPERVERRTFMGKSMGIGQVRTDTHGGKITENITQAIARDVLFDLIMRIEAQASRPGRIVLHVHDEVVLEVPKRHADQRLADILGLMEQAPSWAPGLLVKGEGRIMERYGK